MQINVSDISSELYGAFSIDRSRSDIGNLKANGIPYHWALNWRDQSVKIAFYRLVCIMNALGRIKPLLFLVFIQLNYVFVVWPLHREQDITL